MTGATHKVHTPKNGHMNKSPPISNVTPRGQINMRDTRVEEVEQISSDSDSDPECPRSTSRAGQAGSDPSRSKNTVGYVLKPATQLSPEAKYRQYLFFNWSKFRNIRMQRIESLVNRITDLARTPFP